MSEGKKRLKCVGVDCANMILPTTAEANGGYCLPCTEARRADERRKFIAENKRVVDPYAGISDPVELICALHTPRKYDALVEYAAPPESVAQLYGKLSAIEAEKLMDVATEALTSGNEYFADEVATSMATLTDYGLDRLLNAFVQRNKFWPSIIFRKAGPGIRDGVIAALGSDIAHADHALSALAWIGDETVRKQFQAWDAASPVWQEHLSVRPLEYSYRAGWEIDSQGRRDLFHGECFAIETASTDQTNDGSVVVA